MVCNTSRPCYAVQRWITCSHQRWPGGGTNGRPCQKAVYPLPEAVAVVMGRQASVWPAEPVPRLRSSDRRPLCGGIHPEDDGPVRMNPATLGQFLCVRALQKKRSDALGMAGRTKPRSDGSASRPC